MINSFHWSIAVEHFQSLIWSKKNISDSVDLSIVTNETFSDQILN